MTSEQLADRHLKRVIERAELVRERDRRRPVAVEQTQVDEVDAVDAQRAQSATPARSSSGRCGGSHAPWSSRRAGQSDARGTSSE